MRSRLRTSGWLNTAFWAAACLGCGPHRDPTAPAHPKPPDEHPIGSLYEYRSAVTQDNTRPLLDAARPFAQYLNQIHAKIHPFFADSFLGGVNRLPPSNALSNPSLFTRVELVLAGSDGRILRRGILRSSSLKAFDIWAMRSVEDAAPFGTAPPAALSFDGNVYIQWDLRRDAIACSTLGAHPYLLKSP